MSFSNKTINLFTIGSLVQIIFCTLDYTEYINWPWYWVWFPVGFMLFIVAVVLLIFLIINK